MKKKIDYYGDEDSYIHLKFGNARKCYCFTSEFRKKYPKFVKAYERYWEDTTDEDNIDDNFYSASDVVAEAKSLKLPANFFYFNYTDTPAKSYKEIEDYLEREN